MTVPVEYHLELKEFPAKYEAVYVPRDESAEKLLIPGHDRRRRMRADEYPDIGRLWVEINGKLGYGTATMIANRSCVLTCAHNVIEHDGTNDKFIDHTKAWFELRENKRFRRSAMIKQYNVTKIFVHPSYRNNPTTVSGFDLALCLIQVPEDDRTVKERYSMYEMPIPVVKQNAAISSAAVVGFPCEHKGEKWGMVADVPQENIKDWILNGNREIFEYNFIDTSEGQSGGPLLRGNSNEIIGVHTGGKVSLGKNWATAITSAKLQWIANCLGEPWRVGGDSNALYLRAGGI